MRDEPPVVLVEVGCGGWLLDDPVVTKDERVTVVSLNWDEEMPIEVVREARSVLEPLRDEHPRFAAVLAEFRRVYGDEMPERAG